MKAYVIALEAVHDEAMFGEYRKQVIPTLAPFEGQFVARGGKFTVPEGEWQHPRTVIIEFPSREAAEGWYKSADYQKIIGLPAQEFDRKSRDHGWNLRKAGRCNRGRHLPAPGLP